MITARGYFVIGLLTGLALWLGWEIMSHLYWTGRGYCVGTLAHCVKLP